MIESLITSKTRIKILLKFFLNSKTRSYLRGLESEFGESSNGIRLELNRMENAGLLKSESEGNRKFFCANTGHPLFDDIHNILRKYVGIDRIIDEVVLKLGDLKQVYVTGDFARGHDSALVDLVLVGDLIDEPYLRELIDKAQDLIKRKIRVLTLKLSEVEQYLDKENALLIWEE